MSSVLHKLWCSSSHSLGLGLRQAEEWELQESRSTDSSICPVVLPSVHVSSVK